MSIEITTESVFWDVAILFASEKKVFITSGPQSRCADLLNGGALELVYFGEETSIEGVKARLDYRERPNSKDLIVDSDGQLPIEAAQRLIKKHGALLSFTKREWSEYFNHIHAVTWSEVNTDENGDRVQRLEYSQDTDNALFWVGASHTLPELPIIEQILVEDESNDQAALQEALAEIESLKEQLVKVDRLKRSNQTRVNNLKVNFDAQSAELEDAKEHSKVLKAEVRSLKRKVSSAEKNKEKHNELKHKFEQLQVDLESTRESLIVREGEYSKSTSSLKRAEEKNNSLGDKISELKSEKKTLAKNLKKSQKTIALQADYSEKFKHSEAACVDAQKAFSIVADAWSQWLGQGLEGDVPPIPSAQPNLAKSWSRQLVAHQPLVTGNLDGQKELLSLRASLKQLKAELELTTQERNEARSHLSAALENATHSDDTLRESLSAERALRRAQERELEESEALVAQQRAELSELTTALDQSKRQLQDAARESSDEDPRVRQLKAQLKVHKQQKQARERLLNVNHKLQIQLTTALEEEIVARAELEGRLEEAEKELRTLRVHRDFPSTQVESRPKESTKPKATPKRSRNERLSSLSGQLKSKANDQSQTLDHHQQKVMNQADQTVRFNKASKQDKKRVKTQAEIIKSKYPIEETQRIAATSKSKVTTTVPRPLFSADELHEQAQRAENILKDRLKKLSRKRK